MRQIIIVAFFSTILITISSCKSQDQSKNWQYNSTGQSANAGRAISQSSNRQQYQETYSNSAEKAYINQVKAKAEQLKNNPASTKSIYTETAKEKVAQRPQKEQEAIAVNTPKTSAPVTASSNTNTRQERYSTPTNQYGSQQQKPQSYDGPFANMMDDVLQGNPTHSQGNVYPETPKQASNKSSSFARLPNDIMDQNAVRTESISYMNEYDRISLKKYNVVIASFGKNANAQRVKESLQKEGEQVTIVKGSNGMHRVIIGSFDTEEEAKRKIQSIGLFYRGQYTSSQLISKYGIPFSQLWILVI